MSATVFASQAERIWYFTGAPTSNLSTMNTWTVDMMSDFYSSSPKMAALRFGTTEGLEQAANGTSDGIQVLSRNSSAACLVAYLADGITVDAAYPSNCHYDPRYTDWYIHGRHLATAANEDKVTSLYVVHQQGVHTLSAAVVEKATTINGTLAGVWAAQFALNSVGEYLTKLKAGLDGSLFVLSTDETGIYK